MPSSLKSLSSMLYTTLTNGMTMKREEQEVEVDHHNQFVLSLRLEQQKRILLQQQRELEQLEQEKIMNACTQYVSELPSYHHRNASDMATNHTDDWNWKKK